MMKTTKQSFLERLTGTQQVERSGSAHHPIPKKVGTEQHAVRFEEQQYVEEDEATAPYAEEEREEEARRPDGDTDEEAGLALDMYETDNELVIQGMIAGVTPENLHISITRDSVTIRGKRIAPQGVPTGNYSLKELYWGVFSRELDLPYEVDTEGAEAIEKYGLLIIRLPKLDKGKKELKVKSI